MFIFENRPIIEYVNEAAVKILKLDSKAQIEGKMGVMDISPTLQPSGK